MKAAVYRFIEMQNGKECWFEIEVRTGNHCESPTGKQSILAARELTAKEYFDFAASRAYYAAFYAASAALLCEGVESSKHSGAIAMVHQRLVKTGKLDKQQGKELNWLFELRSVGDYGVVIHVSKQDAEKAVCVAEDFVRSIYSILEQNGMDLIS